MIFDAIDASLDASRSDLRRAVARFDALTDLRALALELLADNPGATFDDLDRAAEANPITAARLANAKATYQGEA